MPGEAAEPIDPKQKPETFLHTVEVDITDEEAGERTKHLLDVLNQIDTVEMDKASRVSDLNAQLKQLRKEATKVRQAIKIGKERRDIECYEQPDERRNIVFIVRASDNKPIDERAMTLEDRMHLGKSKADAEAADKAANGPTEEASGSGGGTDEAASKAGKGGAGKVTRIRASDVKKRKAEREAKEAAEKAKKLADEQAAKNAAANDDDDSDDDSDEDDDE